MGNAMSSSLRGTLLALAGVLVLSPDSMLVRLAGLEQWSLLFYRGLGVFACLSLAMIALYRRNVFAAFRSIGIRGAAAGACFAVASTLFIGSLYHTSVANTLAIISSAPLFGAVLTRAALKERLPGRTWAAVLLCILAVGIIMAGSLTTGGGLFGDCLALAHAVFLAATFVLVRSRAGLNMVPCTALSGLLLTLISLPLAQNLTPTAAQIPPLALLVLVVLPISFALLFLAPRYIPAPEVNMIMLLEMVLGPFFVWLALGERVPAETFAGGGLLFFVLLAHSLLALRAKARQRKREDLVPSLPGPGRTPRNSRKDQQKKRLREGYSKRNQIIPKPIKGFPPVSHTSARISTSGVVFVNFFP